MMFLHVLDRFEGGRPLEDRLRHLRRQDQAWGGSALGGAVSSGSRHKIALRSPSFRIEIDVATETMRLGAGTGSRFWRTRRDRITSALLALLLAFLLGFFVLGRGPGTLTWLTGSRLTWLPFVGAGLSWLPAPLDWLPLGAKASGTGLVHASTGGGPVASAGGNQSPIISSSPILSHGPAGGVIATPAPRPSAAPIGVPTATPNPVAGLPPLPTPTPSDISAPTPPPTPADSPTPTPTSTNTPKPTPTAVPTPVPTPTPTQFVPVVLYTDNFSSDVALGLLPPAGWSNEPAGLLGLGGYTVGVDGGNVLKGPGGHTGFPSAVAGSASWTDYTVGADLKVDPVNGYGRLIARHQSTGNFYACGLDAGENLFLGKQVGGAWTTLGSNGYSFNGSTWYHVDFSVQGNSLTCTVSEPGSGHSRTLTASASDFPAGSIGATGEYGSEYRNFVVTSLP